MVAIPDTQTQWSRSQSAAKISAIATEAGLLAGPHDPPAASRELVQELLDLLLGIEPQTGESIPKRTWL